MCSSSIAVAPTLTTSARPVSVFSAGVPVESTWGAKPARSSRYNTEHSAHNPVAGQPAWVGGVESVLAAGTPDLLHATESAQRATTKPRALTLPLRSYSAGEPRSAAFFDFDVVAAPPPSRRARWPFRRTAVATRIVEEP